MKIARLGGIGAAAALLAASARCGRTSAGTAPVDAAQELAGGAGVAGSGGGAGGSGGGAGVGAVDAAGGAGVGGSGGGSPGGTGGGGGVAGVDAGGAGGDVAVDDAADGPPSDGPGGCPPGYADCDGTASNGCETAIANDAANCGACGHGCLGGGCAGGKCQPVKLANREKVWGCLALDNGNAFWNDVGGAIFKIAKTGGTVDVVPGQFATCLALDDTAVYWTRGGIGTPWPGEIVQAEKSGANQKVLATGEYGPTFVAVGQKHVYWTNEYGSGTGDGNVARVSKSGGPVEVVATGQKAPRSIRLDDVSFFWYNNNEHAIRRRDMAGGPVTVLASNYVCSDLSLLPAHILCAWAQGGVLSVPKSGGPVVTLVSAQEAKWPTSVEVDGAHFYWTEHGDGIGPVGSIRRRAIGGGPVEVLAAGLAGPFAIALDATAIYWINGGTNDPPGPGPKPEGGTAPGAVTKLAK